jgi:hypothetical protein
MIFLSLIYSILLIPLILVILICVIPTLLSIPAFYILRKKRRIFTFDYGICIYPIIYLCFLKNIAWPTFSTFGFLDMAYELFFVCVFSLLINYIKIFIPNKVSTRTLSFSSLAILFLLTTVLFFFIAQNGENYNLNL